MGKGSKNSAASGEDDFLPIGTGAQGPTFPVRVQPRARRDEVAGLQAGCLRVRLQAPPVEGKANKALVRFLAQVLGVSRSQVELVSGERSRTKRVLVRGGEPAALAAALAGHGVKARVEDPGRS